MTVEKMNQEKTLALLATLTNSSEPEEEKLKAAH
jgi:hypothetical protein